MRLCSSDNHYNTAPWFGTSVIQCNVTKVIVFVSRKFSEMGAGAEKGQFAFGYDCKIIMEVVVYFK